VPNAALFEQFLVAFELRLLEVVLEGLDVHHVVVDLVDHAHEAEGLGVFSQVLLLLGDEDGLIGADVAHGPRELELEYNEHCVLQECIRELGFRGFELVAGHDRPELGLDFIQLHRQQNPFLLVFVVERRRNL